MQPWQQYYIFVELKKLSSLWCSFSDYLTHALTVSSALVGDTEGSLKMKIHLLGGHIGLFHLSAMSVLILLLDIFPYKNIPTEEMWKQDWKAAQLFSGGVFKCPVWASLGEWSSYSVLSAVQQGLERDGEEGLEWSFHLNFPDPLGIWMPGAGEKLLSEQKHCKHEC